MSPPPTSAVSNPPHLAPWAGRLLVALFVVATAAPGLATAVGFGQGPRGNEAEVVGTSLMARAARFDAQFAFRSRLVRWQATLRYRLLGVSPLPTVMLGRDGWWFYADDGALEDATSAVPFTDSELDVWRTTLQHTADWLAARGIGYVFVLAPDKHTVYPQFLPAALHRREDRVSRADQLMTMLRTRTTVPAIDLRAPLKAAATGARVYHLTDTHWNDRGAAVAYRQIISAVRAQHPAVPAAWPDEAFRVEVRTVPGMDLAEMSGLTAETSEQDVVMLPRRPRQARIVEPVKPHPLFIGPRLVTERSEDALPRALVYRDSFGSALVPFLAEHFARMVTLWEYDVVPATIREEQPQVVIQQWAGRRLYTRMPYDSVAADLAAMAEVSAYRAARSNAGARR